MKDHLFCDSCDGDLYDTRIKAWHLKTPLRSNFKKHHREIKTTQDLKSCLRAGPYAWPGGYALAFVCSDGGILSFQAVQSEFYQCIYSIRHDLDDGWRITGLINTAESDDPLYCDHTGSLIDY